MVRSYFNILSKYVIFMDLARGGHSLGQTRNSNLSFFFFSENVRVFFQSMTEIYTLIIY